MKIFDSWLSAHWRARDPDEARHMNRLDRLAVHVKRIGPGLLFPHSANNVDVGNLRRLKTEGASNEMYSFHLTYSVNGMKYQTVLILRMYRHGEEIGRKEFAVLKALKEQNIPVPSAYSLETSKEIMGKPFVIMEKVVGKSASNFLHDGTIAIQTVDKLAESLAMVHKLDPSCINYPGLFIEQPIFAQRKLAQTRALIKHKCRSSFPPVRRQRYSEALELLEKVETCQRFPPTLLHGDFTSDHVLMTKDGWAIIDWEDATVGDPAFEVGWIYHTLMWVGQNQIDHRIIRRSTTVGVDLREHFVKCYERYIGHNLANLEFYKNLAALQLALLYDGRLRPGIFSAPIVPLGLKGRFFGAFFVRNEMRPFSDYCAQQLESKGILH